MSTNAPASVRVIPLSRAGPGNYVARRGKLAQGLWFLAEMLILNNRLVPLSGVRVALLRAFGAHIGSGCRCPHPIRVKYPWNLTVGDDCWIGDGAWLYNQADMVLGSNVCISQGAFLTTGSHDTQATMDLRVDPIQIEDGAWVCSYAVVQKGVTIGRSAVVTPLSVVTRSLPPGGVYGGNPARFVRMRFADTGLPGAK